MQVIDFSPGRTAKMKPVEKKTHRQLQYELARKERRLKIEACKRWRKKLKREINRQNHCTIALGSGELGKNTVALSALVSSIYVMHGKDGPGGIFLSEDPGN